MKCNHCHSDKPPEFFYASNKSKCKECVKDSVKANRQQNLESIRAYDRMRGSMPHRIDARKEYQATDHGRKVHLKANNRYRQRNLDRARARNLLAKAVKSGKATPLPCLCCGAEAEAHHPDYSAPLDVVWLCDKHHKEVHKQTREMQREIAAKAT